jgi:hypothetical protein
VASDKTTKNGAKPDRRDSIHRLLADAVAGLPQATGVFQDLVSAPAADRAGHAERLHKVESDSDARYLALIHKIGRTFITPFDREDMYALVEALDDVVDQLDHAADLLVRFQLGDLPAELVDNGRDLHQMARLSVESVDLIKKPEKLETVLAEVNRLENAMDARYRDLLVRILDHEPARDAIKLKILADGVEEAATKLEAFDRAVGIMAIKET